MTESNEKSPTPEKAPPSEVTGRERLAQLLSDEQPETAETPAGESHETAVPGKPQGKPKELKDLAERHAYSDEDLYAIEVPMADGKKMSIGKLKDAAAKQVNLEVRELAFEERVANTEAEWTRAQTEFAELTSMLDPKAMTPAVKEKVRAKVEENNKRERALILKTIPEWANETVREAELQGMVEHLKDFGLSDAVLSANVNHKLFRLVRQAFKDRKLIRDANAKVQEIKRPSTTGKSGAGNGAPPKPVTPQVKRHVTGRDRLEQALNPSR